MRGNSLQKKSVTVLAFLLGACSFLLLSSMRIRGETLPFKSYTTSDGLAHDRVNRIVRDSRGFLWFCTSEGLSRFDGYEFKNYTQDDGLPHRSVVEFFEARNGQLWIGTGDGLVSFDPHGRSERAAIGNSDSLPMFRVIRPDRLQHEAQVWTVNDLIEDRKGVIWMATSDGLYTLEGQGTDQPRLFQIPSAAENKNEDFSRLLEDRSGAIWSATEYGLYRISADRTAIQIVNRKMRVGSMLEDREGRVWIGSVGGAPEESGLHLFSISDDAPKEIQSFHESDGLAGETWLNALLETADGRIIVGIGNGLSEYVPAPAIGAPSFRTLSSEAVVATAEDSSGNVWFSTNSSGVRRMAHGGFVNFSEADNFAAKRITSIISSSDGKVYILAELERIYRFDGDRVTFVRPLKMVGQSWGRGRISFRDHTGAWWIAGGNGLQRYPPVEKLEDLASAKPLKTYTTRDGLFFDTIFQLFEDSRGDIWISSIGDRLNSVTRWERSTETIHRYTAAADGFPVGNPPTAFAEDHAGNIWMGHYNGGLGRYRDGKFELFGAEKGLPSGYINSLLVDSNGRLWAATSSGGVTRIDDPTAQNVDLISVSTHDGLSSNQATCITEDNFGRIYVGTGRGVNRLDMRTGRMKVFLKADGLPENIISQCQRDASGALWFGTWNGLARYVPAADEQSLPPPVFLSALRVNGESIKQLSQLGETNLESLSFSPEQRQVQIDFFAIGFGVGESLRYQYMLEGVDEHWSDASTQRMVSLNLSPGTYSFLVRAINAEGIVSADPARASFSIARPIWQRSWFLMLVALAVALAGYFIYRYRLAQLLKLERVRTRIAADLHDDIGSSLSQIAILSEVARHGAGVNGSGEPLIRIAETSREMVDSMSDIVWAINPQKDHLRDVIHRMRRFAGDTFDSTDAAYRFVFDESTHDISVGADLRREIYLIFKECINNIAKHSKADSVSISVLVADSYLTVTIADNGLGFDMAKTLGVESNGYGGNGLLNMRKRAERLGGEFTIDSKPGEGTSIRFRIPTGAASQRRNIVGRLRASKTRTTEIRGDDGGVTK